MFYDLKEVERDGQCHPLKDLNPGKQSIWRYIGILNNGELYRISRNFNDNSVCVLDSSFNDITHSFKIEGVKG